jgi:hypothetical protein
LSLQELPISLVFVPLERDIENTYLFLSLRHHCEGCNLLAKEKLIY